MSQSSSRGNLGVMIESSIGLGNKETWVLLPLAYGPLSKPSSLNLSLFICETGGTRKVLLACPRLLPGAGSQRVHRGTDSAITKMRKYFRLTGKYPPPKPPCPHPLPSASLLLWLQAPSPGPPRPITHQPRFTLWPSRASDTVGSFLSHLRLGHAHG